MNTTNYNWLLATNLGDYRVWGPIVNNIFIAIDAELYEATQSRSMGGYNITNVGYINKMAITAPATASTLTIDDGTTFRVTRSMILSPYGTDSGAQYVFPDVGGGAGPTFLMSLDTQQEVTARKSFTDGTLRLLNGPTAGTYLHGDSNTGTYNIYFPNVASDTVAVLAGTQTFTNKTLTSPHFTAGTATAGTAPAYFNSGALLTVPVAGAFEFLTDNIYFTITTGAARKVILHTGITPYDSLTSATGITGAPNSDIVMSNGATLISPVLGNATATSLTAATIYGGTTTTSALTLKSTSGAGTTGADIIFGVGNNGGTEAMRILNSGNVGINLTDPKSKLHIMRDSVYTNSDYTHIGSSVNGFVMSAQNPATGVVYVSFGTDNTNSISFLQSARYNVENLPLIFQPNGGFTGVATITPVSNLTVKGTASSASITSGAGQTEIFTIWTSATTQMTFGGESSSPYSMWIQTRDESGSGSFFPLSLNPLGGYVGIGKLNPDTNLHIYDLNNYPALYIDDGTVQVELQIHSGSDYGFVGTKTNHDFQIYINNTGIFNFNHTTTNLQFSGGQYTTGAGTALLGTNCPASTLTAPNTWLKFEKSDGTVVYVPAWA